MSSPASALDEWLTTKQVATHFDIPPKTVLRMIREKRLPATQKGWVWLVQQSDLPETWPPPRRSR